MSNHDRRETRRQARKNPGAYDEPAERVYGLRAFVKQLKVSKVWIVTVWDDSKMVEEKAFTEEADARSFAAVLA